MKKVNQEATEQFFLGMGLQIHVQNLVFHTNFFAPSGVSTCCIGYIPVSNLTPADKLYIYPLDYHNKLTRKKVLAYIKAVKSWGLLNGYQIRNHTIGTSGAEPAL